MRLCGFCPLRTGLEKRGYRIRLYSVLHCIQFPPSLSPLAVSPLSSDLQPLNHLPYFYTRNTRTTRSSAFHSIFNQYPYVGGFCATLQVLRHRFHLPLLTFIRFIASTIYLYVAYQRRLHLRSSDSLTRTLGPCIGSGLAPQT